MWKTAVAAVADTRWRHRLGYHRAGLGGLLLLGHQPHDGHQCHQRCAGRPALVSAKRATTAAQDRSTVFVRTVVADTEDTWSKIFAASGQQLPCAQTGLYNAATRPRPCGTGQAAMGPFIVQATKKSIFRFRFLHDAGAPTPTRPESLPKPM